MIAVYRRHMKRSWPVSGMPVPPDFIHRAWRCLAGVLRSERSRLEDMQAAAGDMQAVPWPAAGSVWMDTGMRACRPFYFIHIPKTAGTSLIAVLDRLFHQERIFPAQLWRELTPELVAQAGGYSFFRGHFGGGGLKVFSGPPPRLLTMVRDPVALSVSTYHFVRREQQTRVHSLVRQSNMSLAQFVSDPRTAHLVEDRQVRYLSFDIHDDPDAQDIFLSEASEQVVRQWLPEYAPSLTAAQRHDRALAVLKSCDWFGIQERFDDALRLFAWRFGLPPLGASERLNARDNVSPLTGDQRAAIEQRNVWDRRLYAWAVTEFDRRFRRMCVELEKYRQCDSDSLDELLCRSYRQKTRARLQSVPKKNIPGAWHYDFSAPLIGRHWHRRELSLPEQRWFRWTGPAAEADIWLILNPGRYVLRLDIVNAIDARDIPQIRLWANNVELSVQASGDEQSVVRQIQAVIPARAFSSDSLLRLRIKTPTIKTHAAAFGSEDGRRVGVAVRSIDIDPV